MRLGDIGNRVTKVQDALIRLGFLTEEDREPLYGIKTKKAVMAIQADLGYRITGVWEQDYDKLYLIKRKGRRRGIRSLRQKDPSPLNEDFNENKSTPDSNIKAAETYDLPKVEVTAERNRNFVPPANSGVDQFLCYLENLNTGSRVVFYSRPDSISDNMTASFDSQIPKSRTSPIQSYANSGPREISFSVILHQDYSPEDMRILVRKLQGNVLPIDKGGYIIPPKSHIVAGDFIDVVGVCTSVSTDWMPPYHDNNVFNQANVSFSFTEVEDTSRYADQWESSVK